MARGAFYGNKARTKADMRTAAFTMLTMRASLDGVTEETLIRSYGLSAPQAAEMLADERLRRARRA